jgi:hypothetical protein
MLQFINTEMEMDCQHFAILYRLSNLENKQRIVITVMDAYDLTNNLAEHHGHHPVLDRDGDWGPSTLKSLIQCRYSSGPEATYDLRDASPQRVLDFLLICRGYGSSSDSRTNHFLITIAMPCCFVGASASTRSKLVYCLDITSSY